jgi:hypothetical protein
MQTHHDGAGGHVLVADAGGTHEVHLAGGQRPAAHIKREGKRAEGGKGMCQSKALCRRICWQRQGQYPEDRVDWVDWVGEERRLGMREASGHFSIGYHHTYNKVAPPIMLQLTAYIAIQAFYSVCCNYTMVLSSYQHRCVHRSVAPRTRGVRK